MFHVEFNNIYLHFKVEIYNVSNNTHYMCRRNNERYEANSLK